MDYIYQTLLRYGVCFNMVNVGVTRKAREQIANLFYAGSSPVTNSTKFWSN